LVHTSRSHRVSVPTELTVMEEQSRFTLQTTNESVRVLTTQQNIISLNTAAVPVHSQLTANILAYKSQNLWQIWREKLEVTYHQCHKIKKFFQPPKHVVISVETGCRHVKCHRMMLSTTTTMLQMTNLIKRCLQWRQRALCSLAESSISLQKTPTTYPWVSDFGRHMDSIYIAERLIHGATYTRVYTILCTTVILSNIACTISHLPGKTWASASILLQSFRWKRSWIWLRRYRVTELLLCSVFASRFTSTFKEAHKLVTYNQDGCQWHFSSYQ